jgi:hypothetical protein
MRKVLEEYINSEIIIEGKNLVSIMPVGPNVRKTRNHPIMSYFEEPIMADVVQKIVTPNGNLLNVGYGLGLFDKEAQKIGVSSHTIIECHPKIAEMCDLENVEMICSTWQEAIPKLIEGNRKFDTIWFDTYMFQGKECFQDEWINFISYIDELLSVGGVFSMFTNNFPKRKIEQIKETVDLNKFTLGSNLIEYFPSLKSNAKWYELFHWTKNNIQFGKSKQYL